MWTLGIRTVCCNKFNNLFTPFSKMCNVILAWGPVRSRGSNNVIRTKVSFSLSFITVLFCDSVNLTQQIGFNSSKLIPTKTETPLNYFLLKSPSWLWLTLLESHVRYVVLWYTTLIGYLVVWTELEMGESPRKTQGATHWKSNRCPPYMIINYIKQYELSQALDLMTYQFLPYTKYWIYLLYNWV